MPIIKAKLIGLGGNLGNQIITNDYYAQYLDTSDEWIQQRTGIKQRHIIDHTQSLTTLASTAFQNAITDANISPQDIDVLLIATTTHDQAFPSCATAVHNQLHLKQECLALDIAAACNGFIYALKLASLFIQEGKTVAIIGADTMSKIVDKNDRSTVVLFGDGAGCMIWSPFISHTHSTPSTTSHSTLDTITGFMSFDFGTDGSKQNCLYTQRNPLTHQTQIHMQGQEVFINAVRLMSSSIQNSLTLANITANQLNLLIPHQANIRILHSIQQRLNLQDNQIAITVAHHANTSAASIPLAALEHRNQLTGYIAFCGVGSGLSWGSCILKL